MSKVYLISSLFRCAMCTDEVLLFLLLNIASLLLNCADLDNIHHTHCNNGMHPYFDKYYRIGVYVSLLVHEFVYDFCRNLFSA